MGNKLKQSDEAYLRFKKNMLSGQIALGETITQTKLAEMLGVQISPLRVAINKLESEGFVKVFSRSGVQVIKPDLTLIRNSYQLRMILERAGLKYYLRTVSDNEVESLLERHKALLAEVLRSDSYFKELGIRCGELDSEMHFGFIGSLGNDIMDTTYSMNEERIRLIRMDRASLSSNLLLSDSIREHIRIVEAIQSRDEALAVICLDEHLSNGMKRAMGL